MSIELPPSGYEKSPEACSGMLMFRVINANQIPNYYSNVTYIASTNVTMHGLTCIKVGHFLLVNMVFNLAADFAHGASIVRISGFGYPKWDNSLISCLASSDNKIAHLRASNTGNESITITTNGVSPAANYYSGTVIVPLQ